MRQSEKELDDRAVAQRRPTPTHVSCVVFWHAPEQHSDGLPHLGLCWAGTSALPQEQLDGELDVLVLRAYGKGAAVLKRTLLAPVERHLAHAQQLHPSQQQQQQQQVVCYIYIYI